MSRARRWSVVLVAAALGIPAPAQVPVRVDSAAATVHPDTARARTDTSGIRIDSLSRSPYKSPLLAMGLSALLPGGGQLYNGSYWKVPVVVGLGGYFLYQLFDLQRQYASYRDQYRAGLANPASVDPLVLERILAIREFYKDERDRFGWYFLILYVINIADAYVDASLFGFDVGDNLGFRGGMGGPAVTIRIRLP